MAYTVKNLLAMQETWVHPWVGKIPWRRAWQPPPVFLIGEYHGQRSHGYSSWGRKIIRHDWSDLAAWHDGRMSLPGGSDALTFLSSYFFFKIFFFFWCGPFSSLYWTFYNIPSVYVLVFWLWGTWDLSQGSNPHPLYWRWRLNHWTAREAPS